MEVWIQGIRFCNPLFWIACGMVPEKSHLWLWHALQKCGTKRDGTQGKRRNKGALISKKKKARQNCSNVFFITLISLERECQETTFGSWFSHSAVWVLMTEYRSSDLAASAFTHWVTLQAHVFAFESQVRDQRAAQQSPLGNEKENHCCSTGVSLTAVTAKTSVSWYLSKEQFLHVEQGTGDRECRVYMNVDWMDGVLSILMHDFIYY